MKCGFIILLICLSAHSYSQENELPHFISFAIKHIGQPKESLPGTFSNATGTIDGTKPARIFAYYYYPADSSLLIFEDERFSSIIFTLDSTDKIEGIILLKTFSRKSITAAKAVYTKLRETLSTILAMEAKEKEWGKGAVIQNLANWSNGDNTIGLTSAVFNKGKKRKFGASLDVSVSKTNPELLQQ